MSKINKVNYIQPCSSTEGLYNSLMLYENQWYTSKKISQLLITALTSNEKLKEDQNWFSTNEISKLQEYISRLEETWNTKKIVEDIIEDTDMFKKIITILKLNNSLSNHTKNILKLSESLPDYIHWKEKTTFINQNGLMENPNDRIKLPKQDKKINYSKFLHEINNLKNQRDIEIIFFILDNKILQIKNEYPKEYDSLLIELSKTETWAYLIYCIWKELWRLTYKQYLSILKNLINKNIWWYIVGKFIKNEIFSLPVISQKNTVEIINNKVQELREQYLQFIIELSKTEYWPFAILQLISNSITIKELFDKGNQTDINQLKKITILSKEDVDLIQEMKPNLEKSNLWRLVIMELEDQWLL